jgi:hypothetical protein
LWLEFRLLDRQAGIGTFDLLQLEIET